MRETGERRERKRGSDVPYCAAGSCTDQSAAHYSRVDL